MNKKSFLALSFAAIAIVSGYAGVKAFRSQACCENDLLAQNIEALSESESSEWEGKKLKIVDCYCDDGKKKGVTLKCSQYGDLEICTAIQQGLNGCYKVGFIGSVSLCNNPS